MTDPIADMITRIKNAYLARKKDVSIPYSNVKYALAKVLMDEQYIASFEKIDAKPQADIVVILRYVGKRAAVTDIKRVSKPGRRLYTTASKVERTLGGYGCTILSTSMGLMTDKTARAKNIGGEIICKVW